MQPLKIADTAPTPREQPDQPFPPMLTIRDIAEALKCDPKTVRRQMQLGKFPKPDVRLGRLVRWRAETIEQFIKGGSP